MIVYFGDATMSLHPSASKDKAAEKDHTLIPIRSLYIEACRCRSLESSF
jgi:hypothetical protein